MNHMTNPQILDKIAQIQIYTPTLRDADLDHIINVVKDNIVMFQNLAKEIEQEIEWRNRLNLIAELTDLAENCVDPLVVRSVVRSAVLANNIQMKEGQ